MERVVELGAVEPGQWTPHALHLRDIATFQYAHEFYRAAQKAGPPIVRAYLLGHSIELFLKCYLMKAGLSASQLKHRPYGHDLVRLFAAASEKQLSAIFHISPSVEESLARLTCVYPETLRYFSLTDLLTQPSIPPLAPLFRFAKSWNNKLPSRIQTDA